MKNLFAFFLLSLLAVSCDSKTDYPYKPSPGEWKVETLSEGLVHYSFSGFYEPTNYNQIINVLEVDVNNPNYDLSFNFITRDSLSHFAPTVPNAVAAINGTYGDLVDGKRVSFLKTNGSIKMDAAVASGDLRAYKHEGAFYYDKSNGTKGIEYGTKELYASWIYPNIISGAPVLIDNFKPVGETFVDATAQIGLLPDEHKDKMHAVRHPRTAIAITEQGKVLLITVDGRRFQSGGMSAKELTQMLKTKFNPKYALNLDGGGSTTMWIKGSNVSSTGVVNYPTDNGKYNHYGQRELNNCIVVTNK